jgi:hypothetical protein
MYDFFAGFLLEDYIDVIIYAHVKLQDEKKLAHSLLAILP